MKSINEDTVPKNKHTILLRKRLLVMDVKHLPMCCFISFFSGVVRIVYDLTRILFLFLQGGNIPRELKYSNIAMWIFHSDSASTFCKLVQHGKNF